MSIKIIENWRRLKEFDDELDIDFMKSYLKTVEEQFNYNFPRNNSPKNAMLSFFDIRFFLSVS